ncbi:MAG: hypothetical protein ACJ8AO_17995 [Gemmatimonadaceae bacterium]
MPAAAPDSFAPTSREYPRAGSGRTVLGEYATGSARRERFELSIAQCVGSECPVQVRLLDDAGERGTVSLDWPAGSREPTRTEVDRLWRTGDASDSTTREAWTAGDEEREVDVAARRVTLAPGVPGLLVWQRGGFEHVKRRHYVVAPVGGRLARVWTGEERAGPTWSDVLVVPGPGGADQLMLYEVVRPEDDRMTDVLDVTPLAWDGSRLVEAPPGRAPLFGVASSAFGGLRAARAARTAHLACLQDFVAVTPRGASAGITLLAAAPSRETAETIRARAARCAPWLQPRVVSLRSPYSSDDDAR